MSVKKTVTAGFVAGAVAMAIAGANEAHADKHDMKKEKCYGVAKAGQNDCGAADKSHSCMGHATEDASPNEWVAVPAGLCEKLVGGSLVPGEGDVKSSCEAKASCDAKSSCAGKDDHEG